MASRRARLGIASSISLVALAFFGLGFDAPAAPEDSDRDYEQEMQKLEKMVEQMVEQEREKLKPLPLVPIPDNPPPHEGAMIDIPYVVEPPDFLMVEVLEALPGRPLSGERLVRADGTITLGFYGDVYVRGLTLEQVKTKVVLHLRRFINDETLGLLMDDSASAAEPIAVPTVPVWIVPPLQSKPEELRREKAPKSGPQNSTPGPRPGGRAGTQGPQQGVSPSAPAMRSYPMQPAPNRGPLIRRPIFRRKMFRRMSDVREASAPPGDLKPSRELQTDKQTTYGSDSIKLIRPADTGMVYIDIGSYNSKNYYVYGDVGLPGRYPCTGNETVLDVLSFAAGLLPTADPNDIRLVRPARGDAPARVYKIDWKAIMEQGDAKANLQIFPGDRLYVDRDEVVKTTVELNRMAEPVELMIRQFHSYGSAMRSVNSINQSISGGGDGGDTLTPAQREAFLKDFADLWWKYAPPGSAKLDKESFKELLIRSVPQPQAEPRKEK
jgi:protein involved in polysaccharide export with SLBB domain